MSIVLVRAITVMMVLAVATVQAGPVNVKYLDKRKWTLTQSPHFEILSDAKPAQVITLAEQLERFRGFSVLLLRTKAAARDDKMLIVATKGRKVWTSLGLPKEYISLVLANSGRQKDHIFVQMDGFKGSSLKKGNAGRATVLHSIAFSLFTDLPSSHKYPLWYKKGFSHYLASYSEPKGKVMLGAFESMAARLTTMFHGSGFPRKIDARALMTRDSMVHPVTGKRLSNEESVRFGATAFMMVHYLYADNQRRANLGNYLRLVLEGSTADEALEAAFAVSFEELSNKLGSYLTSQPYVRTYPIKQIETLLELPTARDYDNTLVNDKRFWQLVQPMIAALNEETISHEEKKALFLDVRKHLAPIDDTAL